MVGVLMGAKLAAETAAAAGLGKVDTKITTDLCAEYDATLDVAFALLPAGAPPGVATAAGGTAPSARRGTSPPACAATPTRCCASSTATVYRSRRTRRSGR